MTQETDTLLDAGYRYLDLQDPVRARQAFGHVSRLDPGNAEAWLMLGALDGEAGNLPAALDNVRRAVEADPGYLEARLTLAHLYSHLGRNDEAIAQAREATRIAPDESSGWELLSGLAGRAGDFATAEAAARTHLALDPDSTHALVNLASARRGAGNLEDAVAGYRKVLELERGLTEAWLGLGNTLLALGRPAEALEPLRVAASASPANAEARGYLGSALLAAGHAREALEHLVEAVRMAPSQFGHLNVAKALEFDGRHAEALDYLVAIRAPDGQDDRLAYTARRAAILHRAGDDEAAWALLAPLVERRQLNIEALETYARLCREFGSSDQALDLLDQADRALGVEATEGRRALLFASGSLLERVGRHDEAFQSFVRANELATAPYNREAYGRYVDRLIDVLSPERVAALPVARASGERPIFIVGMPRSGTSLVEQILASHPDVFGGGELYGIFHAVAELEQTFGPNTYPECLARLDGAQVERLAGGYLDQLERVNATAARVTDKMPHNFQHLALIRALFPKAPIVHVRRDPLDTCLSCYALDFAGQHGYSANLADLGFHYRQYERLMAHYRDVLKIPMFEVDYEMLVSDPDHVVRALLAHCGLAWDDACLTPHAHPRVARTASYAQVRRPINSESVGRWKHYEKHLTALREALDG